jgi:hypothetical protein
MDGNVGLEAYYPLLPSTLDRYEVLKSLRMTCASPSYRDPDLTTVDISSPVHHQCMEKMLLV